MAKTLYVPDHVARSKAKDPVSAESAYVEADQRVLDPSLIDKSLKERLPQPTGWRLLVMPYQGKAKTDGGILIPDQAREGGIGYGCSVCSETRAIGLSRSK